MTPKEARERLVTARVDLEILAEWLTETDRPGAGDMVQKDLVSIVDAINTLLPAYQQALAVVGQLNKAITRCEFEITMAHTQPFRHELQVQLGYLKALLGENAASRSQAQAVAESYYIAGTSSPRGEFG